MTLRVPTPEVQIRRVKKIWVPEARHFMHLFDALPWAQAFVQYAKATPRFRLMKAPCWAGSGMQ